MTTTSDSLRTTAGPLVASSPAASSRVASWRIWGAILWFVVTFPWMTFPELIWPEGRLVAVAIAGVSTMLGVWLLAGSRPFDVLIAVLAALTALGWAKVSGEKEALTHLTGVAVGVLAMGIVAVWCRTPRRVAIGAMMFLLAGLGALSLGLAGTTTAPFKLLPIHPSSLPQLKLGLPGLPENGWVNPNALGGTALMIVPLALALVRLPAAALPLAGLLRLAAGATALMGIAAIIIGQARTVWLAAWFTALIAAIWAVRNRSRRALLVVVLCASPLVLLAAARGADALQPSRILAEGRFAAGFRMDVVWGQAIEQVRTSPWTGIGLNHFRHVYRAPDWMREGTRESAHAHNIWLQTALDLGLVGLVLYVAVLALLLWRAAAVARAGNDTARRLALGSALGLVGVHLFGMADAVSLGAKVGLFQWILAGFILAASHLARPAGARA